MYRFLSTLFISLALCACSQPAHVEIPRSQNTESIAPVTEIQPGVQNITLPPEQQPAADTLEKHSLQK